MSHLVGTVIGWNSTRGVGRIFTEDETFRFAASRVVKGDLQQIKIGTTQALFSPDANRKRLEAWNVVLLDPEENEPQYRGSGRPR